MAPLARRGALWTSAGRDAMPGHAIAANARGRGNGPVPPVNDQWNAVFATPIPFLLTFGFVAAGVWAAMLWRYKAVNEKTRELYELLNKKTDLAAEAASQAEAQLRTTINKQTEQIASLETLLQQQKDVSEETTAAVADLAQTSMIANAQVVRLGQANNAVSAAISDTRRLMWEPNVVVVGPPLPLRDAADKKPSSRDDDK
jgi:hypothetical protein